MEQLERHSTPAARDHWWSSRRGQTALLAISGCLVELLPVEAWLLVLAGVNGDPLDQAAVPFWFLCLLMAVAWVFGYRARGRRGERSRAADLLPLGVLYLLALRISPAAFGDDGVGFLDLSWISARDGAALARPGLAATLILLFLLLAFLWWRAAALASGTPTSSTALRRFGMYFGLLLLAGVGLNAVQPAVGDPYGAALTLLVIGDVFCGLLSAALIHLGVGAQGREDDPASERNDARWIGIALLVDVAVVVVALFASLIFNFQSFLSLLGYLGPVGQAIGSGLAWLANLLAAALTWLISTLFSWISLPKTHGFHVTPPKVAFHCVTVLINGKSVVQCGNRPTTSSFAWLTYLGVAVILMGALALIGLVLYVVLRKVLIRPVQAEDTGVADERESLDGRSLFAAQVRDLLNRFGQRGAPAPDALQRGTVRYMYRDVLRAAKNRGLDRPPAETPDEYARRLSKTPPLAAPHATGEADDFLVLNDAYNGARYAESEPDALARAVLQERARRLTKLFGGNTT